MHDSGASHDGSRTASPSPHLAMKVLAVLVVYERSLDESVAWRALSAQLQASPAGHLRLTHVLVYDNSHRPRATPAGECASVSYVHDQSNGGTAAAYACGIALASRTSSDWLLLLDHDTQLPDSYLSKAEACLEAAGTPPPAALLPWVMHDGQVISPAHVSAVGTIKPLLRSSMKTPAKPLTGIASGCLLHVPALRSLLPLPRELWLDYLDHWIFHRLARSGRRIEILDCTLDHDLSVADPAQLSTGRLSNLLVAERYFIQNINLAARLVYPFRLAARALRWLRLKPAHSRAILRHAFHLAPVR